jgi:hypothetical protein
MKNFKKYILLFIPIVLVSCTKVINLKLGNDSGKLVIDANVTDSSSTQIIKLSDNVPFTNTNTFPAVTGATVTVTDPNGIVYPFTESPAGTYTNKLFPGVPGDAYQMTVISGGVTYHASSTMPQKVALDSVTDEPNDFDPGNNKRKITVHFHDPKGVSNYYNFIMYINGVETNETYPTDDEFTDGNEVNFDLFTSESDPDIYPGDKVTVEMQCVDKTIYTYWFTIAQQQGSGVGGGVAPSNPPNNITPTAFGYFSAHTSQTETITVK